MWGGAEVLKVIFSFIVLRFCKGGGAGPFSKAESSKLVVADVFLGCLASDEVGRSERQFSFLCFISYTTNEN